MPWSAGSANLGFSSATPWLPPGETHRALAVDRQERDPASALAVTRACLALRSAHPALRHGRLELVEAGPQRLVYDRSLGRQRLRCTFNLSSSAVSLRTSGTLLFATGECADGSLAPYAALIEELA